jgi:hypothetical protein
MPMAGRLSKKNNAIAKIGKRVLLALGLNAVNSATINNLGRCGLCNPVLRLDQAAKQALYFQN